MSPPPRWCSRTHSPNFKKDKVQYLNIYNGDMSNQLSQQRQPLRESSTLYDTIRMLEKKDEINGTLATSPPITEPLSKWRAVGKPPLPPGRDVVKLPSTPLTPKPPQNKSGSLNSQFREICRNSGTAHAFSRMKSRRGSLSKLAGCFVLPNSSSDIDSEFATPQPPKKTKTDDRRLVSNYMSVILDGVDVQKRITAVKRLFDVPILDFVKKNSIFGISALSGIPQPVYYITQRDVSIAAAKCDNVGIRSRFVSFMSNIFEEYSIEIQEIFRHINPLYDDLQRATADVRSVFQLWTQDCPNRTLSYSTLRDVLHPCSVDDCTLKSIISQYDSDCDSVLNETEFTSMMLVVSEPIAIQTVKLYFQGGDSVVTSDQLVSMH